MCQNVKTKKEKGCDWRSLEKRRNVGWDAPIILISRLPQFLIGFVFKKLSYESYQYKRLAGRLIPLLFIPQSMFIVFHRD